MFSVFQIFTPDINGIHGCGTLIDSRYISRSAMADRGRKKRVPCLYRVFDSIGFQYASNSDYFLHAGSKEQFSPVKQMDHKANLLAGITPQIVIGCLD